MKQPERFETRKQDQSNVKPENPALGQHTLSQREIAQSIAGPKPFREWRKQIAAINARPTAANAEKTRAKRSRPPLLHGE